MQEKRAILTSLAVDAVCFAMVGLPRLFLHYYGVPYQRGFFCDDNTIRYPYKQDTVTPWTLHLIGFALPISVMLITELNLSTKLNQSMRSRVFVWVFNMYKAIAFFMFGLLCSDLITDVGKLTIGRLRPHFYSVCSPDIDCTSPKYASAYITNFRCLEGTDKLLREARLSFPSGHSSFSSYTMVYTVVYIQMRTSQSFHLFKKILQLACILVVWVISLSRISDHKHHWSDVLVGLMIGTSTAIINAYFVSNLFDKIRFNSSGLPMDSLDSLTSADSGMREKPEKLL